ncbi:hypothetical protein ACH495_27330 [Micromonospora sp. NPDC018662]|uniref:hypothetical protein n=1 Tax=Micromonospora sp. NPDC018662 TaxID=3364238 RepID=UPI0037B45E56
MLTLPERPGRGRSDADAGENDEVGRVDEGERADAASGMLDRCGKPELFLPEHLYDLGVATEGSEETRSLQAIGPERQVHGFGQCSLSVG